MFDDAALMARALQLAARARGQTSPNPMVGAVVAAADGRILGSGFHARAGLPHAEVHALRQAGALAHGATLFCTLEPCCHHGRTPPCTDRIVESGIARVVMAAIDPNPKVSGAGIGHLRAHGIRVEVGLGAAQAERLNRPFFTAMRSGRPWVLAKVAVSADGRVAAADGARTAISSAPANRRSQLLRAEVDAIAVGSTTMMADDPMLTCREVYRARPLMRVIFDRRLRTPPTARVFGTTDSGPIIVVTDDAHVATALDRVRRLRDAGASVLTPAEPGLLAACRALLAQGVQSLLIEGGPSLHRAAFDAGVVDALRVIVAPRMLGPGGVPWLEWGVAGVPSVDALSAEPCGPDVILDGDVYRTH